MAPLWARALLRVLVPAARRGDVLGDLDEVHARRKRSHGTSRAWFATSVDALHVAGAFVVYRWRDRRGTRGRGVFGVRNAPHASEQARSRDMTSHRKSKDLWGGLRLDVSYAGRTLWKDVGFTTAIVLTLALGIGASIAIFTVVDAILLRTSPYDRPEQLVNLVSFNERFEFDFPLVPIERAQAWPREAEFLTSVGLYEGQTVVRTAGPEPQTVEAQAVSVDLARTLGVSPDTRRGIPSLLC